MIQQRARLHVRRSLEVFVVEDDPEMSAVVCDAVRADGASVSAFTDGKQALRALLLRIALHERLPGLLITDVRLPGIGGIELLEGLRRAGRAVPALIMSGYIDDHLRANAAALGVIALFDKPFDVDVLRATVQDHDGIPWAG